MKGKGADSLLGQLGYILEEVPAQPSAKDLQEDAQAAEGAAEKLPSTKADPSPAGTLECLRKALVAAVESCAAWNTEIQRSLHVWGALVNPTLTCHRWFLCVDVDL